MKELSFEEALKRLEKIAEDLENDDVSLDVSLKHYEEGMRLIGLCNKKLEEAKKKVDVLVKKEGKKFQLKDFDEKLVAE
ncbi:MAG: exodeoxyribonuclease VII small subunit [Candidatus Omnitrophica bacterium]|nr:exodeoxyribonuclease VII small subunit [Pseudomonadota bacterium]MBU4305265.1 exodeoxyribonuclease VII small subunit [Candidatus Omnitrophota bacterium]MBU4477854.1 exodeoxyribonuclease VII small subunit [Candidatus Omnitrophota bacterium]MCG2703472.1 exodeoxyribonuclease VII small subunit [Candidatus Omnitrophota bacterium]